MRVGRRGISKGQGVIPFGEKCDVTNCTVARIKNEKGGKESSRTGKKCEPIHSARAHFKMLRR